MAEYISTRNGRVLGNASAANRTLIAASTSALILGIYVAADGVADIVNIQDADGNAIADIAVGADDTGSITTPFLISNGLLVVSGASAATTYISVFYRPGC